MDLDRLNVDELKEYFTKELLEKFDDSAKLVSVLPLIYKEKFSFKDAMIEQITGYENLYRHLLEPDAPTSCFFGFKFSAFLVKALEFKCPSAYCVLLAEAIKMITAERVLFEENKIENSRQIISKSIELFGALGHYFGLRFTLQLGHHFFIRANHAHFNFFSEKEYAKKNAAFFYGECYRHFEKFRDMIDDTGHTALFQNAFMGKEIKTVFLEETGCAMDKFNDYLARYYSKVSLNNPERACLLPV